MSKPDNKTNIVVGINYSSHGTGDLHGFSINLEYRKQVKKRITLSFGLTSTIHDGKILIAYFDSTGDRRDASLRINTSGVQLTSAVEFTILKTKKNQFAVGIAPLVRYQTTSRPNDLFVYFPAATGFPLPVLAINNTTPQRTLTAGGLISLSYNRQLSEQLTFGVRVSTQNDTRLDVINQIGLSLMYRLIK
ncbi:MAG: hypothetical protein EAZ47_03980 [Bacteroidetes bacterium]|nr:MAG: hypothetical protein EAY72_00525 [Bacteroidota bacterium]TAF94502.1 MAG: hypothetical protein EAZ47_03980 [Bacteroidota bacterium]